MDRTDLLLKLNEVPPASMLSRDELADFLKAAGEPDGLLRHRALTFAVEAGVFTHLGDHLVRSKSVTQEMAYEFDRRVAQFESSGNVDVTDLAYLIRHLPTLERRVCNLEHEMTALTTPPDVSGQSAHWISLNQGRMPRPVLVALMRKAQATLGADAPEKALHNQMVLIAAQLVQEGVLSAGKPKPT